MTCPELEDGVALMQATQRVNSGARLRLEQFSKAPKAVSGNYPMLLRGEVQSRSLQESVDVGGINIVLIKIILVDHMLSTTSAGITRRIGAHHNLSGVFNDSAWIADVGEPGIWTCHGALDAEDYGPNPTSQITGPYSGTTLWKATQALQLPTFLWTMVRDPAALALDMLYANASNASSTAEKLNILEAQSKENSNSMFRYLRSSAEDSVDDVFAKFGLVSVFERLEESVVVLAATLKIPLSDVLYVQNSAVDPSFVLNAVPELRELPTAELQKYLNNEFSHPSLSEEPTQVQEFMKNEFRQSNDLDQELYRRANDLLDEKIAEMKLESAIEKFREILAVVQEHCGFCNDLDSGYVKDEGCNYQCLDNYDGLTCEWCE